MLTGNPEEREFWEMYFSIAKWAHGKTITTEVQAMSRNSTTTKQQRLWLCQEISVDKDNGHPEHFVLYKGIREP